MRTTYGVWRQALGGDEIVLASALPPKIQGRLTDLRSAGGVSRVLFSHGVFPSDVISM